MRKRVGGERLENGGIPDISSKKKITKRVHLSLFRPFLLVIPNCFLRQSFLDMLPSLLRRGKRGMSGGHSEMLTTVKIHEVQNSIVSLLSFRRKIKRVPIAPTLWRSQVRSIL